MMAGAARWVVRMRFPDCLLVDDAFQLETIVGGLLQRHETT